MSLTDLSLESSPFDWEDGDDAFPADNAPLVKDGRTEARICAVQALYATVLMKRAPVVVAEEFKARLTKRKADKKLFTLIMAEAEDGAERARGLLEAERQDNWDWDRMDPVLRALCLAGVAELGANTEAGTAILINEYLNIAKGFLKPEDVTYIHRTLDGVAKKIRG
jgi:N utilization substance protein B